MVNAVLIIAHKNKNQLIRLIKSLEDNEFDIFVHIDKKWKITKEEIVEIKRATSHVTVLDKRISGFLDTWSLCQITIELIKKALIKNKNYKYFILLSG
ncbi:beta-1,6-N-acetylglucosaminyltransferase [Thomasclavelia cocleata]|uniref:beta-1,6-N-acetylglucosaminyltransferase n=1 Tax=Thomasclavelia cocleata TaxID=69824 RepID=UPI00242BB42C|nr:beta-1,6-N-acetylglucosaminyltransferase [Thomasclavelia cocleata]